MTQQFVQRLQMIPSFLRPHRCAIITFLLFFTIGPGWAQQKLSPLQYNDQLAAFAKQYHQNHKGDKAIVPLDTIQPDLTTTRVIFRDDFSDYAGWPDIKKWIDHDAYINNSFGYRSLSYGVATFDGMDSIGKPYNILNPSAYGENDHLTSQPINLSVIDVNDPNFDSVYLSFYYQPQGMNPFGTEEGDSLILQFYNPATTVWKTAWSVDGKPLQPFKKVTLLLDTAYYKDAFQFRFINYGNQTGNVDHWNIDYVLMTSNEKNDHEKVEDMAFRRHIPTLLKDFTAMPYWHYQPSDMLNDIDLEYYYFNNFVPKSSDIKSYIQVLDESGTEVFTESTSSPEFSIGFVGSKTINLPFNANNNNFYPIKTNGDVGYFKYKIFYEFNDLSLDSNLANDTLIHNQVFGSYYAYDDGVAEAGYGVFGSGNMLAYKFDIGKIVDTLTGVNMYFSPVVADRSSERFQLTVWFENGTSGNPGIVAFTKKSFDKPIYSSWNIHKGVSNFVHYPLDTAILVTGRFFIGWTKVSEERMNIGYDVNRNSQDNIYVNVDGVWSVSDSSGGVVPGSLMMRPVFRNKKDPVIGITNQDMEHKLNIYPNPASNQLHIAPLNNYANEQLRSEIYNLNGQLILTSLETVIDVASLENGMYLLRVSRMNGELLDTKKLLISH